MIDSMTSPEPKPMIILIAGPYQSGADGDPVRIAANLRRLEQFSLPIYRAGHVPMIGEWVALPVMRAAGLDPLDATVSAEFLYPTAARLLRRCDAVLRIPGESKGADEDVRIARTFGLPVYTEVEQIPGYRAASN